MKKDNKRLIFTGVFIAFVLLLATSCTTQRRIDKICSSGVCVSEQIIIHDTSYIERYDTIYRLSAWDSLLLVSSWNPDKVIDTVLIEDKYWKGQFYVSHGSFTAKISHLQDSIDKIVKTIEKSSNNVEIKTVEVKVPVEKPIRDKKFKLYRNYFWISIIIVVCLLAMFALKKWNSLKLKWLSFISK